MPGARKSTGWRVGVGQHIDDREEHEQPDGNPERKQHGFAAAKRHEGLGPGLREQRFHSASPVSRRNTSSRVWRPARRSPNGSSCSASQVASAATVAGVPADGDAVLAGPLLGHRASQCGPQRGDVETSGRREADVLAAAAGGERGRRARGDYMAAVDDRDDVGDAFGFVEVVRGEKNARATVGQAGEDVADDKAGLRVDAGGGLVEEHDLGLADERQGQAQPLLLAAGKSAPRRCAPRRARPTVSSRASGSTGSRVVGGGEPQGVTRVHPGVHAAALEHHADARGQLLAVAAGIETEDPHLTGSRLAVALERFDGAGFAGAVGTEERVNLAGLGGEVTRRRRRRAAPYRTTSDETSTAGTGAQGTLLSTMIDVRRLRTELEEVKAASPARACPARTLIGPPTLDRQLRELSSNRDDLRKQIKTSPSRSARRVRPVSRPRPTPWPPRAVSWAKREAVAKAETDDGRARPTRVCCCRIPNLPAPEAVDGASEADNPVLRVEGFDPEAYGEHQRVPHWDIGIELKILDFEAGARISGSMFPVLRGAGATLSRALCQLALDRNADAFEEIRPPSLVRTDTLAGIGPVAEVRRGVVLTSSATTCGRSRRPRCR